MSQPRISFVLATFNRLKVLLHTLECLENCGLSEDQFETLVVDNASTDGTAEAVRESFRSVVLLRQAVNRGPCAKNEAVRRARGEFIVFLDDDSFPLPGSVERMMQHFAKDPQLGAAIFTVTLPDGSRECSAYPDVCIGCGTGFRRRALIETGGLPEDFFMAAEEYDLSLRMLDAGWRIRCFEDVQVTHLKSPLSRYPSRIVRLDARNNVMLAMRYFPEPWRQRFVRSWLRRYHWMAIVNGRRRAFWAGAMEGLARGMWSEHRPIGAAAFEQFAKIDSIRERLAQEGREKGLRKILLIDLGKNYLAYSTAAKQCGLEIVAIADARLGGRGFETDGIPLLTDAEARRRKFDAAVISNLSRVHAAERLAQWRSSDPRPVIDLFEPAQTFSQTARAA